jgi:hypothetical protein
MTNRGGLWGLTFACIGLLLALVVLVFLGGTSLISRFSINLALGAATTLLVAWSLGALWAPSSRPSLGKATLFGAFVAVAALELGVVAGSVPGLITSQEIGRSGLGTALFDFVVKPAYWVNLFGLVPAIVLGALFGIVVEASQE